MHDVGSLIARSKECIHISIIYSRDAHVATDSANAV